MWLFMSWSKNIARYSRVHFITPLHQAWYFAETNYAAIASMHSVFVIALVPKMVLLLLRLTEKQLPSPYKNEASGLKNG